MRGAILGGSLVTVAALALFWLPVKLIKEIVQFRLAENLALKGKK